MEGRYAGRIQKSMHLTKNCIRRRRVANELPNAHLLEKLVEVEDGMGVRTFDQGDRVLTVATGDVALAAASDRLSVGRVIIPIPMSGVVFALLVAGVGYVGQGWLLLL